ncbi:MAG: efflux RND transporter periplasmic adaptor subunit [Curvibacter sp.]|nr:efflux RND transporter periplasmic adaptor subunit [Curvibacter sp.]
MVAALAVGGYAWRNEARSATPEARNETGAKPAAVGKDFVDLNDSQVEGLAIKAVGTQVFNSQRNALGSIDFNENLAVQVFTPYQGKIIQAFADVGDHVRKGQKLFTIDSPDLTAAESNLLTARGVYDLTTAALERAKELYKIQGLAQKDYEQAVSDQTGAEAGLKSAREAVRIFGKDDAEIQRIESQRRIDAVLPVYSPVSGLVTARMAQPGLLVQPGNAPAPFVVADTSTKWLLINAPEADSPLIHAGQELEVSVPALPQHHFKAKVKVVGASVDPATRTVLVRAEINDPDQELRSGMYASYVVRTGDPVTSVAVPADGVVREGDGSMSVWVTTDRRHMVKRSVSLGREENGFVQVTQGLKAGELIATEGAIFLSNMLVTAN